MNLLEKLEKIDDILTMLENDQISDCDGDHLLKTCYILYSNGKKLEIVNDYLNYIYFKNE